MKKKFKMTSLKSIMERRTMHVLDVRDMKNLKGGLGLKLGVNVGQNGGGLPPPTDHGGNSEEG